MIASGYYGSHIWRYPVAEVIGFPELFGNHSFLDFWVAIVLGSFFVAHLPACIYNVAVARRRQNLPVLPVFLEWTPMVAFTGSVLTWLYSPYSTLLSENRLILFCITMSFVFGRMTTKIILAHLLKQPFPYWTVLLTPLVGGAILGNLPRFGLPKVSATVELWYLRGYFLFAFVAYMHWALLVINRITTYLGINCLTIKEDKSTTREKVYHNFGDRKPNSSARVDGKGNFKHH
jgi:ethanolaminephosphotransferase